jgi:hypothetical protein
MRSRCALRVFCAIRDARLAKLKLCVTRTAQNMRSAQRETDAI